MVIGLVVAGISVSVVVATRLHTEAVMASLHRKKRSIHLQGVLEWAAFLIATSPYRGGDNLRLVEADPSIDGAPGATPLCKIGDAVVTVNRLSERVFQIRASSPDTDPIVVCVSSVSFPAQFCLITTAAVNIAHSNYHGGVLSHHLRFVLRRPLLFTSPLISVKTPKFASHKSLASTFSYGLVSGLQIEPRIVDVLTPLTQKLRKGSTIEKKEGMLVVRGNCAVEFRRDTLSVTTEKGKTEMVPLDSPLTVVVLGDCRVSGELEGRVSLLVEGRVWLCGDTVYVSDGNRVRFKDGRIVGERGDAALAIIAKGDILYAPKKENLIVCGALASIHGAIRPAVKASLQKLLIFGTRICKKRPWRWRKGAGFRSATYIADPAILATPPPVLPAVTLPRFFAYRFAPPRQRR